MGSRLRGLVAQPWPDRENLSEDIARKKQEQGGLMWLLDKAQPDDAPAPKASMTGTTTQAAVSASPADLTTLRRRLYSTRRSPTERRCRYLLLVGQH